MSYSSVKRAADLLAAGTALLVLSPVMLTIAVAVRLGSPGPVLYRGRRVGREGHTFEMCKFRTMVQDAESRGGPSTSDTDPRLTAVGPVLRKYKLDELPQLWNVVKGEMSFVGPRPEVPQYVSLFTHEGRKILTVRPGITDLATLWNSDEGAVLAGASDPEEAYLELIRPTKIRLQLEYVRRQSLRVDLWIVWQTLLTILLRRGPRAPEVLGGVK